MREMTWLEKLQNYREEHKEHWRMSQKAFEDALKLMKALREAAANGDKEAQLLLEMSEKNPAGFVMTDLSKWRKSS
jgi:hypothetical protein